jgi:hypothetical protein
MLQECVRLQRIGGPRSNVMLLDRSMAGAAAGIIPLERHINAMCRQSTVQHCITVNFCGQATDFVRTLRN